MLSWEQGESAMAERWLLEAGGLESEDTVDPVPPAALAQLGLLYGTHGRGAEAIEVGRLALSLQPVDAENERTAWIALAVGEASVHGAPAGLVQLAQRLPQPAVAVAAADTDLLIVRGMLGFYAGQHRGGDRDLKVAVRLARQGAAAAQLPALTCNWPNCC